LRKVYNILGVPNLWKKGKKREQAKCLQQIASVYHLPVM